MESQRIDKWLWAARFYKTRAIAVYEISKGRVQVNGLDAKPSREIRAGDTVCLRQGSVEKTVRVLGLSLQRGPAPQAQQLYQETPESLERRNLEAERQRLAREPAHSIEQGRPTKRDRRQLEQTWNSRWSASLD